MIQIYLKQAWTLIKQNRLFTSIYVVGTGLSIALVMTLFIIYYVKFAPIYPEYNRDRTLVIKAMKSVTKDKSGFSTGSGVSYYVIQEMLSQLPHLEAVGAGYCAYESYKITLPTKEQLPVASYYVDGGFWRVFTFRFIQGHAFTQEEVEAKLLVAVVSESLARRLFASTDVVGEVFTFNRKQYRVCGVVEDVSNATPATAADLWIPLSANMMKKEHAGRLHGYVEAYLLAESVDKVEALRQEVQEVFKSYNQQHTEYENDLMNQPDIYWKSTFRVSSDREPDVGEVVKSILYVLLALLFIPALNLSGMISSRMDARLSELGVRKVYGANNLQLFQQVLCENLLLTCMGGLVGLLLSYLIVLTASDWILTLFDERIMNPTHSINFTFEMLFNPWIFLVAFGLCLLLNLVSGVVPTAWALRRTIIQSIHSKR